MSFDRIEVPGVRIGQLPEGGAYVHNAYVFPEARGKRVLQTLAWELHEHLRARGCRFSRRLIDKRNAASLIGTERLGIDCQAALMLKLPGLPACFLGPRFEMGRTLREG